MPKIRKCMNSLPCAWDWETKSIEHLCAKGLYQINDPGAYPEFMGGSKSVTPASQFQRKPWFYGKSITPLSDRQQQAWESYVRMASVRAQNQQKRRMSKLVTI